MSFYKNLVEINLLNFSKEIKKGDSYIVKIQYFNGVYVKNPQIHSEVMTAEQVFEELIYISSLIQKKDLGISMKIEISKGNKPLFKFDSRKL